MQVKKESTSYEMTEHYLVSFNTFYVSIKLITKVFFGQLANY